MPYIQARDREVFDHALDAIAANIHSAGELNYVITKLCVAVAKARPNNYDTRNTIMGVLACATAEFYRRGCAEYEDKKAAINGDVYGEMKQ